MASRPVVIVVMPAYNAARTLQRTYEGLRRDIVDAEAIAFGFRLAEIPVPTRYFSEASSVNFRNSVIYGPTTLRLMGRCLLDPSRLRPAAQFLRKLPEIISRYHAPDILRDAPVGPR